MNHRLYRCVLGLMLAAVALMPCVFQPSIAAGQESQQLAAGNDLKAEAFRALRAGQFDRTSDLLNHAAELLNDPSVKLMAQWASQYTAQRQEFLAARHKQFDKAIDEVKLLQQTQKDKWFLNGVERAYLYADDKNAFRKEAWVDQIVAQTVTQASKDEENEQWFSALRLYSELSSVEPANPLWKEKLKGATRRVRLLALYTPDEFRLLQEKQGKEREEIDRLLHPTTQPLNKPTTEPVNDSFRIEWKESLKGVRMEMLSQALYDARLNYYREVPMRDILLGGLNGVRAVLTTKGLEKAFACLEDGEKKADFTRQLDNITDTVKNWDGTETALKQRVLANLRTANNDALNLPEAVLVNEFADGAFAELDPFSNMIWPSEMEEFAKMTTGEFSGVGVQIESEPDGSLRIVSPLEDTPAYKAGVKAGDIISAINGKNAKGITINQAVKTITGPSGTMVDLTIRSQDGRERVFTIKRETIKVASIKGWLHKPGGGWDYFVDPDQKIAYLRLTNFTKTTSDELDKAAAELTRQGAKALILDLRANPGGLLDAATKVCNKFMDHGVIVSTHADRETPNHPTVSKAKAQDDQLTIPLIVMVNQYSASASEIVSGALKDQNRAMVVGERTFGKGSVQMLFPLMEDHQAFLKLTTSHYYLPSGRCIHREENSTNWGVDPDVTVEMTPEQMRVAILARQELDVLRDAVDPLPAPKPGTEPASEEEQALAKARKDPVGCDSQLSAALLLLRLRLAGAQL